MKTTHLRLHLEFGLFDTKIVPSPRKFIALKKFDDGAHWAHQLTDAQRALWQTISGQAHSYWLRWREEADSPEMLQQWLKQTHNLTSVVETPYRLRVTHRHKP
jgi:hypothetical protein